MLVLSRERENSPARYWLLTASAAMGVRMARTRTMPRISADATPSDVVRRRSVVYVVDDDAAMRDSLRDLLDTFQLTTRLFASAEDFLNAYSPDWFGCILLDIRMPQMSGLAMQEEMQRRGHAMPIVFITGHGDVPMAVTAMHRGAVDFIQKPFRPDALISAINLAFANGEALRADRARRADVRDRVAQLTSREREVMQLVASGKTNRAIAEHLHISPRSVEAHRAKIMSKTRSESLAQLIRIHLIAEGIV